MFAAGIRLFAALLFVSITLNQGKAQNTQTVDNGANTKPITLPGGGCAYKWTVIDNPQIGFTTTSGTGDIPSFTAVNNTNQPITAHVSLTPVSDGFAYLANSTTNNVSVINTATYQLLPAAIAVDKKPYGVAVSPDGRRVYVVNSKNGTGSNVPGVVSVIDAASNTVVDSYTVGRNPTGIAVSPDGTRAYVVNEGTGSISVLDITANKTTIPDIPASGAIDVAVSADGSRIYVSSSIASLYVIDAASNQLLKKIPIQSTFPTALVVSPDGAKVYLTNNTANYICSVDVATGVSQIVIVGTAPFGLAITPAGDKLYVTNALSNSLSIISTATNTVKTLNVPSLPEGISVSPNGKQVFVVGQSPNELEVIDTGTDQLVTSVPTGQGAAISLGNFVTAGIGCNTMPVVYSITVNPPPSIYDPGSMAASSTHYGTASTAQVINVGGNGLKGPITVTSPTGYEVSKDDIAFKDTVMVSSAGDIAATEVFVRLKATAPAGSYHGSIQLSSPNATTVNVQTDGTVLVTQLNITANNIRKFAGDPLPVLTVTYTGFVNGDGPSQLTTQPIVTTTATASSPIGKYPVTVSGASAKNYVITYVAGTLEVVTGNISTPNAFTPNGDGINDTWDIKNLNLYAECTVEVLNRYGQKVFYTNGYPIPWDGKLNGQELPVGTYYYIIKLKPGAKPLTGPINVIR